MYPPSDTDLEALIATYTHGKKPALRRRAHAIVLSHQRHTINQICKILSVTRETVSLWFDAWEAKGLEGLSDKPRVGRPSIYSDEERERLRVLAEEQPHQLKAAQARLQQETGKCSSTMTIKRALKKLGYSLKRARRSLKGRCGEKDFRNTQGLLAELQHWEDRGEAVLFR